MNELAQNYYEIVHKIEGLSKLVPQKVNLIAVSKTFPTHSIKELHQLGQNDFAENYAQEFYSKAEELKNLNLNWHFIGNIQSNKIKLISQYASWVHSLTSAKQAVRLDKDRPATLDKLNVLIEINISGQISRHGLVDLLQVRELAKVIANLPNLTFRGLMGIASVTNDTQFITAQFHKLQEIFNLLCMDGYNIDTLSMGMSHDYELAIQNGATQVRIGSLIFGKRTYT